MDSDAAGCVGIVVVFALIFLLGFKAGSMFPTTAADVRQEAIEHHVAEWRCDPQTGEKTFAWIECGGESDES